MADIDEKVEEFMRERLRMLHPVNDPCFRTQSAPFALLGHPAMLREYLAAKGDNAVTFANASWNSMRPLHLAVTGSKPNDVECLCILLQRGADPGAADRNGNTPLHYSIFQGTPTKAAVLVSAMSVEDIMKTNHEGHTALESAKAGLASKSVIHFLECAIQTRQTLAARGC